MASSLLVLLDDIATVLDDVGVMTKVAVKKTAGVLGDDLALNAKQVSGVAGERELPVVWAVAKGSAVNKLILVPAALAISWLVPWLVTPLLVVGGLPRAVGVGILAAAPVLMRVLSVAGTAAMFLVGGGIIAHAIPAVHDAVHGAVAAIVGHADHGPAWLATLVTAMAEGGVGVMGGLVAVTLVAAARRLRWRDR